MQNAKDIFEVKCKNCGAAVGFDILSQSYRCASCGTLSNTKDATAVWTLPNEADNSAISIHADEITCPSCGATADYDSVQKIYRCPWCNTEIKAATSKEPEWKVLNALNWKSIQREEQIAECTSCGAKILFKKDEASETCTFCGGHLVRNELKNTEELPKFIIPFVLTEDEAKERLCTWLKTQKNSRDKRRMEQNVKTLKGWYLPYRLIRGPLEGIAYRDLESKKYKYRGFLDYAVVNASVQLDNQILDAAEPFDLSELKPFEEGYIGGHRVKLSDLSPAEIQQRTYDEALESYRPYVSKALHGHDVEMRIESGEFMYMPILLPMYIMKVGAYLTVVNGQTGKVAAASRKKPKASKFWLIEPTVLTAIATVLTGYFFAFAAYPMMLMSMLAGILFFSIYGESRNSVLRTFIYSGKDTKAKREDGELILEEGRGVLKNPLSNMPAFYESDGSREAHVEMKFYTPARMLSVFTELSLLVFLPAILAIIINRGIDGLAFQYGAAWYVTAGGIVIIYCTRGLRWDIFNHPILYEVLPDGKKKLFGTRRSRRLSVLSLFGLDSIESIKELGSIFAMIIGFTAFILLGSTLAIIY